jgi:hypothetical protein
MKQILFFQKYFLLCNFFIILRVFKGKLYAMLFQSYSQRYNLINIIYIRLYHDYLPTHKLFRPNNWLVFTSNRQFTAIRRTTSKKSDTNNPVNVEGVMFWNSWLSTVPLVLVEINKCSDCYYDS